MTAPSPSPAPAETTTVEQIYRDAVRRAADRYNRGERDLNAIRDEELRSGIAAALRAERDRGAQEMRDRAATCCDPFDCPAKGATQFVAGQATAAQQIRAAIRKLPLSPPAPAGGDAIGREP